METFTQVFGALLLFVYQCFDRVMINAYLSALTRPENVVYFFRQVRKVPRLTKQVLAQPTTAYQAWVEAFAKQQQLPLQWAERGVRKEDAVRPYLEQMEKRGAFGVYFIMKSLETAPTFRVLEPKRPTADPNYTILKRHASRYTHYYFYLRDPELGPLLIRIGSFLPFTAACWLNGHGFIERELRQAGVGFKKHDNAIAQCADPAALQAAADRLSSELIRQRLDHWLEQLGPRFSEQERAAMGLERFYALIQVEYCRNFVFRHGSALRRLHQRSCELGLWRLSADKISVIFGQRLTRRLKGKLQTTLERMQHGAHVLRAYCRGGFLKQYEKLGAFLRQELVANNLADFGLKKGLDHLEAARRKFAAALDRFAQHQAALMDVHVEHELLAELARPALQGRTKVAGIKLHDARLMRLMELLLQAGVGGAGFSAAQLHRELLERLELTAADYSLTQLRYDLRKLKVQGLIVRQGKSYRYELSERGRKAIALLVLLHKRVCGPLADSLFGQRPSAASASGQGKMEAAYHKADRAIGAIIRLLAA